VVLFAACAHAQVDFAVGASTTLSSKNSTASQGYVPAAGRGGVYPSASLDVLLKGHIGFSAEVAVRAKQGLYNGYQGYRPVFYDVNAIYAPRFTENTGAEIMAGVGGQSVLFYNRYSACGYPAGCGTYVNSNHFMVHVGGGFRYYFWKSFFFRPEAHLYIVPNNTQFNSNYVGRVGASIGYSFGSK